MKIIFMNGGLGNQLFQYIFFRYIEENTGDLCYIDDRYFFCTNQHNGYEINKIFGLKPRLLSEFFEDDVWQLVLNETWRNKNVNIVDFLRQNGLEINVCMEADWFINDHKGFATPYDGSRYSVEANSFTQAVTGIEGNVYYYGYWINPLWYLNVRDFVLKELRFPDFDDDYNRDIAKRIKDCNSVALHVRRGDFVAAGLNAAPEQYRPNVELLKSCIRSPVFFLFSDEPDWCRNNLAGMGFSATDEVVIVEGNNGGINYRDMQHMTLCKHMITANSSFSYLAALLNQNPNKYIKQFLSGRPII